MQLSASDDRGEVVMVLVRSISESAINLRTSDSLLKMDIRAAHDWRGLKAACF
jgi:hypothetical protein